MIYAVGAVCFLTGVLAGLLLNHFSSTAPVREKNDELIAQMIRMKKQGFVPQFEIEQAAPLDPSDDIREY